MAKASRGRKKGSSAAEDLRGIEAPRPVRGSVVLYRTKLESGLHLGVIVSNDIQNESAEILLVAPLERRTGSGRSPIIGAPFVVELGPGEGFRARYVARCDWITRIDLSDIVSIERAQLPEAKLRRFQEALSVALGFPDVV